MANVPLVKVHVVNASTSLIDLARLLIKNLGLAQHGSSPLTNLNFFSSPTELAESVDIFIPFNISQLILKNANPPSNFFHSTFFFLRLISLRSLRFFNFFM